MSEPTKIEMRSEGSASPIAKKTIDTADPSQVIRDAAAKAKQVEAYVRHRVHGQPAAVAALGRLAFEICLQGKRSCPLVATFLGPPASGKTFSARLFAEAIQKFALSDPHAGATEFVDAQRYNSSRNVDDLWGGSFIQSGRLTGVIQEHRNAVVIVDELEKSCTEFMMSWLQPLGSGWVGKGDKRVDVSGATIIFTTNLGHALWAGSGTPHAVDLWDLLATAKRANEEKHYWSSPALPAEMVSRLAMGESVLFKPLDGEDRFRILVDALMGAGHD